MRRPAWLKKGWLGHLLCRLGLHWVPNRWYRDCFYWEGPCCVCHLEIVNGRAPRAKVEGENSRMPGKEE